MMRLKMCIRGTFHVPLPRMTFALPFSVGLRVCLVVFTFVINFILFMNTRIACALSANQLELHGV